MRTIESDAKEIEKSMEGVEFIGPAFADILEDGGFFTESKPRVGNAFPIWWEVTVVTSYWKDMYGMAEDAAFLVCSGDLDERDLSWLSAGDISFIEKSADFTWATADTRKKFEEATRYFGTENFDPEPITWTLPDFKKFFQKRWAK